jgi:hypothetical protein
METNPGEKREMLMSVERLRKTENALKMALDLVEILNLILPKYKAYVWSV